MLKWYRCIEGGDKASVLDVLTSRGIIMHQSEKIE